MNDGDLTILDKTLERAIRLERFTAGERKKVLAILTELQRELKARLYEDLTDFSKRRVNALLKEATAIIDSAYGGIQGTLDIDGLARHEAAATAQTFATIGLEAALPTEAVLRALVNGSLIEGSPAAAWWARQSDDLAFKFASQVRQGVAAGETIMDIVRRVAGSPKLGIPGIMDVSRRNAFALVHTSVMQVANDARLATFKANDDIVKGVRQLSTLDGHTSKVCIAYSGGCWDLDGNPIMGTTLPFNGGTPRHFNCRSVLVPITRSFKELGADIEEPPTGTRASDEGQVRADITMTEWLKGKPKAYVDDLVGPGRADLFLKGKITLQDLVSQNGRPLTLEQLRRRKK